MSGLAWQNDNYVCHEAVCPVCGNGDSYGSGDYSTELRVYFTGGTARSTRRPISAMRIKCTGSCRVGTNDVSGLYLISDEQPVNWSQAETRSYLARIGSPFASQV